MQPALLAEPARQVQLGPLALMALLAQMDPLALRAFKARPGRPDRRARRALLVPLGLQARPGLAQLALRDQLAQLALG